MGCGEAMPAAPAVVCQSAHSQVNLPRSKRSPSTLVPSSLVLRVPTCSKTPQLGPLHSPTHSQDSKLRPGRPLTLWLGDPHEARFPCIVSRAIAFSQSST